jgi:hypothetical protein
VKEVQRDHALVRMALWEKKKEKKKKKGRAAQFVVRGRFLCGCLLFSVGVICIGVGWSGLSNVSVSCV